MVRKVKQVSLNDTLKDSSAAALQTVDAIICSQELQQYIDAGQAAFAPYSVVIKTGKGEWVDPQSEVNHHDSLAPLIQVPALYAALTLLGERRDLPMLYAGNSYGLALKMLKMAGFTNLLGIDIDQRAVEFCKSQGLPAQVGDASNTGFPDNSIGIVISRDLVVKDYVPFNRELADSRIPVLDEMHRVLGSPGYAIFTTASPIGTNNRGLPPQEEINASKFKGATYIDMNLPCTIEGKTFHFPIRTYVK